MVVLWDRGECTPDNPYFTTGPLIPLTDQSPDFIASSQSASVRAWNLMPRATTPMPPSAFDLA